MKPGILLVRADATVTSGAGHVMRCLALAQAWQDVGGRVTFAMAESTTAIEERLRSEDVGLVRIDGVPGSQRECEQLAALAGSHNASWVVVDGYGFGADYLRALKSARLKVVLIDDNGRPGMHAADFVLNQNIHAHENLYKNRETCTKLILGTKYALLRREFASGYGPREIRSVGRRILVTMGGSDPDNVTLRAIAAVDQLAVADLEVVVLVGGSNPHVESIAESVAHARQTCRILENVTNMQELISWADLAISAAGTVCWEYCALGLPAVLVAVAENQIPASDALHAAGAARK